MEQILPEGAELEAVAQVANLTGLRVLELGAGDGRLTFDLARIASYVLATDSDEEEIAKAQAALRGDLADRVQFRVAEAAARDVGRGEFDVAFFTWSLC